MENKVKGKTTGYNFSKHTSVYNNIIINNNNVRFPESKSKRIKIRDNNRETYIDPKDICFCLADGCYARVFLKSGKAFLVCKPLINMEKELPREYFFRCHRSYLINMLEIEFIDIEKQTIYQKLYQIPVSHRKTAELLYKRYAYIISGK